MEALLENPVLYVIFAVVTACYCAVWLIRGGK